MMSKQRGKCKYQEAFSKTFSFLQPVNNDDTKAFCNICQTAFSVKNKGRHDIQQHLESKRHRDNSSISAKERLECFFKRNNFCFEELKIASIELLWCYHNISRGHSFRDMDCTSKLLKQFVDKRITCGKTKSSKLVTNVIFKWSKNLILSELESANFIVVSCDASNHKSTKLLPVLARFFDMKSFNVKTRILSIHSLPNETADTVTSVILHDVAHYKLEAKIIGFLADNANVNFGSLNKKTGTECNIHAKLEKELNRSLVPIGCAAHILHNAISTATSKIIPIDVENVVFKIYHHFKIYTVRTEKLKDFCDFIGCEYHRVLSHSKTRWLSLLPCVERILLHYDAIKSYFLSESDAPLALVNFFASQDSEFWLYFIQPQLELFNNSIAKIEKQDITAVEVYLIYVELYSKIKNRLDNGFIPFCSKNMLKKMQSDGLISEQYVQTVVERFYHQILAYMDKWSTRSIVDAKKLHTFLLNRVPSYEEFQQSVLFVYNKCLLMLPVNSVSQTNQLNENEIFDTFCYIKTILEENLQEWDIKNMPLIQRWKTIFNALREIHNENAQLKLVVEYVLTLPGTNADCERVFSLVGSYWSKGKSQLQVETLESVMKIKVNVDVSCIEFYNIIKADKKLLESAKTSEKYT